MDCSPPGSLCPWDSPGKNTGLGCHSLLQGSSWSRDQTWASCIAGQRAPLKSVTSCWPSSQRWTDPAPFPPPHSPSGIRVKSIQSLEGSLLFSIYTVEGRGKEQIPVLWIGGKKGETELKSSIWSKITILTLIYLSYMWSYKQDWTSGFEPCIE